MLKNKLNITDYLRLSKVDKYASICAMKALSNVAVLQLLKEMGAGLRYSIHPRSSIRTHAGYEPEKIFYTPNGVSLEEIEEVNAMAFRLILIIYPS
jgi:diaminopimelate decarboxylase